MSWIVLRVFLPASLLAFVSGVGLIGGSIGLALRRWAEERKLDGRKPLEVVGFDPNLDQQRAAERLRGLSKSA